jgi:hypothetical protein
MPTLQVPNSFEADSGSDVSKEESIRESAKLSTYQDLKSKMQALPAITPRTDFANRQANHLVERICRENGVEAPKLTFAKCLTGQEDQIMQWSHSKHTSVLRLAEYLHKRGQLERDYANSIQKLNRQIVQSGDTDERLGQLIVMGEKTAAGHMDWARKIGEERMIEDLKDLCGESEETRRYLASEVRKLRTNWSKSVGAFEKIRKNKDKALKAADSAQLALDTALARGNTAKGTLLKLQDDVQEKSSRARAAREEYNGALSALTAKQGEIFKEKIPQCFEGFEKMERARIAAVRAILINMAQVHLAVSNIEIESGERWLTSLVAVSVDEEIENFVRSVDERGSAGHGIISDEFSVVVEEKKEQYSAVSVSTDSLSSSQQAETLYQHDFNLTSSESDLLNVNFADLDEIESDPSLLQERKDKLEKLQEKLVQQHEALERMQQAYGQTNEGGPGDNEATLEAVRSSMRGISGEIEQNRRVIEEISDRLSKIPGASKATKAGGVLNRVNPMSSIMEELNRMDRERMRLKPDRLELNLDLEESTGDKERPSQSQTTNASVPMTKKKALSRSFEDIMKGYSGEEAEAVVASPKATGLKLPGMQWTSDAITRSNEEISSAENNSDYYCAEEEEEEELIEERRQFRNRLGSDGSIDTGRRKSIGQSTENPTPTTVVVPKNRTVLFKVQALYNFIGRKETDELDLRTGEYLSVFDGSGEWWEAENEAGVRGYIPFNYVIRI